MALLLTSHVELLARHCLPHLRESGRGRIVAIESSSVREPLDNLALSNAVRPGVVGWLKTLARELGAGRDHREHDRARAHRHRAAPRRVRRRRPTRADLEQIPLAGSGRRPRSRASPRSSPPTAPPTSPARCSRSTAGSRAGSCEARRTALARPGRRRAPRRRPLPPGDVPVERLPLRPERGAHPVADKVDVEGEGRPRRAGGIYYVDVTSGRRAGSSGCCRSCAPTAPRSCRARQ